MPVSFTVSDLVLWKDPKKTGIAFGAGLAILLSLACCSIISVVAYTALLTLTGTLSFRVYKNILQAVQKTNEGHPFKLVLTMPCLLNLANFCLTFCLNREYLDVEITPNNERVHKSIDLIIGHVNSVVLKLRSVFLVEDIVDSVKVCVA